MRMQLVQYHLIIAYYSLVGILYFELRKQIQHLTPSRMTRKYRIPPPGYFAAK